MKKQLLTVFLISAYFYSEAQITFQKTYGDTTNFEAGSSVQQTSDGGYIIAGITGSLITGAMDIYLIKTNSNGDTLWTRTIGGINDEWGYTVQQTNDGGYIVLGATTSFGAGNADMYLIKVDSIGDLLWEKTFGGINDDLGNSVQQTTDGGYILAGTTYSFGAGTSDMFVVKTDSTGDTLWTKTYGGGVENDEASSVWQTSDGGFIISGFSMQFGNGYENVLLIKTGPNGNVTWKKYIGNNNGYEWGSYVQQTSDGGYIVFGSTSSIGAGGSDFLLIKTDAYGDTLWIKAFGGIDTDWSRHAQQTSDGGYILLGTTQSFGFGGDDFLLIKTNVNGDILWTKNYGDIDYDYASCVRQTTDGGYIITGSIRGDDDVYLIKTDSLGNTTCNQGNPMVVVISPSLNVATHPVIVTSLPTIITNPVAITGYGGTVTTLCSTVGISPTPTLPFGEGVAIAPNPFISEISITLQKQNIQQATFTIKNILGQTVYKNQLPTGNRQSAIKLDLSFLSKGIYLLEVIVDGERMVRKIVKQ